MLALAIQAMKNGRRAQFFNIVDLTKRLEGENAAGRQGRLAQRFTRVDVVVMNELGYLPIGAGGGAPSVEAPSRLSIEQVEVRRFRRKCNVVSRLHGESLVGDEGDARSAALADDKRIGSGELHDFDAAGNGAARAHIRHLQVFRPNAYDEPLPINATD